MKHIVTVLLVASLCAFGMVATATKVTSTGQGEYGETMSHIILQQPLTFSGHVFETESGPVMAMNQGTFLLRGVDLDGMVGKNIQVTGVIRGQSIFAVKVDIFSP